MRPNCLAHTETQSHRENSKGVSSVACGSLRVLCVMPFAVAVLEVHTESVEME